jgi:hypothetical protein
MTVRAGHLLLFGMSIIFLIQCRRKEYSDRAAIPDVQTSSISNITTNSATAGGTITQNTGAAVFSSGICYSRTNNNPGIADDTTKGATSIGTFSFQLTNLDPDVTYYVRAYAINSIGVGYGQTVSFKTANAAPGARNLTFIGSPAVAEAFRVRYNYYDLENNPESNTGFQWYIANDSVAGPVNAINNATDSIYTPSTSDRGKFLRVHITPRASSGSSPGTVAISHWAGPVAEQRPDSVNFIYNGQPVTYFVITSPVTGRKWLDRNLGAPNAPTSWDDWQNYGDMFQWGRAADGHQLIVRAATTAATTAVNGTTNARSGSDVPGHSSFIVAAAAPFNWREPGNDILWQAPARTNNPCPAGWHVPTLNEWFDENLQGFAQAYAQLKITAGGERDGTDGSFRFTTNEGYYWTSSYAPATFVSNRFIFSVGGPAYGQAMRRTAGNMVRCIKD